MGAMEIEQFLNFLANEKNVSASTQNQALCALVFLYREVLEQDFDQLKNLEWVKLPSKLPLVLTK
ncbi:MAG: phage integrase N-terminal SAM-like domain-containing protein [Bacteroidetes bacterium]|nr:phage integrase N-terminal SAM-like domain-containing protein [Bacteroidota bacterium]